MSNALKFYINGSWVHASIPATYALLCLNYADWDAFAPFGGYKQSGNGRECADWGIREFLELKAIIGGPAAQRADSGCKAA
jgi:aldehyde dehydrogenase (NAD+)